MNPAAIFAAIAMAEQAIALISKASTIIGKLSSGQEITDEELKAPTRDQTIAKMKAEGRIPADFDPDAPQG